MTVPHKEPVDLLGRDLKPWQADWPECIFCAGKINPECVTGRHFHEQDCIRELRRQREHLIARFASTVKIGWTADDVEKRCRSIATLSGRPLRLATYIPGTMLEEKALHRRFAMFREAGEWFTADPVLKELYS